MLGLLRTEQGRTYVGFALNQPQDNDPEPITSASISKTIMALVQEGTLAIGVRVESRMALNRRTAPLGVHGVDARLFQGADGKSLLYLVEDLSVDHAIAETADMLVSEISAVSMLNGLFFSDYQLRLLIDDIGFGHADRLIRNYLGPSGARHKGRVP
ncbi:hypothetical protein [Yoonia sp.]|jgi:hypothetical protein|uniref:hypothetical protein n=1 Tax=Yoonia sp. TaxID=2212373 RepID=UPI0025DAA85C|nr:hypothetical protein [Yoonia sp.]